MELSNSTAGTQRLQELKAEQNANLLATNVPVGVRLCASRYPSGKAPRYIVFHLEGSADIHRVPFFCGQWACPFCGHVNQTKLRQRLHDAAVKGKLNAFLTITLPPWEHRSSPKLRKEWKNLSGGEYTKKALTEMQHKWKMLSQALKRQQSNFLYASVTKFHKDGTPFRQLLTNWEGSQRRILVLAKRAGLGYSGKLIKCEPEGMAEYLSKYNGEDAQRFPKGYRHYGFSGGLSAPEEGNDTVGGYLCNKYGQRLTKGGLPEWEPNSPMDKTTVGDQRLYMELYIASRNEME